MNLYQIFIRNLTPEGTFRAAQTDLKRIKEMGFDIIYLMPIHPISKLQRKGTYGSPYAISDYYEVNEDYGTKEDLKAFLEQAHRLELKVIMDVVFNHAGADHRWIKEHPDFFLLDEKGQPTRKVSDWSDIVDFNFDNHELVHELINVLLYWASFGFDGFRCDVASLVPFSFWLEAVSRVCASFPFVKWFAESIDHDFLRAIKTQGEEVASDLDLLRLFNGSYDYDIWKLQEKAMKDLNTMNEFVSVLNYRYAQQLSGKEKWHFIENHDQKRLLANGMSLRDYKNWLAFILFQSGTGFVYQGMESLNQKEVSFFEKVTINRDFDEALVALISTINHIKKEWQQEKEVYQMFFFENDALMTQITTQQSVYTMTCCFGSPIRVIHDKIYEHESISITKRKRMIK